MCTTTPATIGGVYYPGPTQCEDRVSEASPGLDKSNLINDNRNGIVKSLCGTYLIQPVERRPEGQRFTFVIQHVFFLTVRNSMASCRPHSLRTGFVVLSVGTECFQAICVFFLLTTNLPMYSLFDKNSGRDADRAVASWNDSNGILCRLLLAGSRRKL